MNRTKPEGTVLIVEDSRTQAEYLGHILRRAGYPYEIAENGKVAMDIVAVRPPSVILTDLLMPEMDGYELCRRIKQDSRTRHIPVIMVTQLFDPADVLRGLESGADNFIIKPFEPESVFSRLAEVTNKDFLPGPDYPPTVLDVEFFGRHYSIGADRLHILHILVSTYDVAIRKNIELQEAQERLLAFNEQLQQMNEELQSSNEDLQIENNARQRAEKDLAQANKKLQLMTSITRHDIINQLTVLQGYLELAQLLEKTDPDKSQSYVRRCLMVVGKTISTIQFTGEYQKIGVTNPGWHNVTKLITSSLRYATPGNVNVEIDLPQSAEIFADPLIEKVVFNLIDNALRYGTTLTTIRFHSWQEGENNILACEDDGVGIPVDEKERIFSFAHGTNTGMGLFLVREILAITGIVIRETGTFGKGARFELVIPPGSYRTV